jgi:hypothetical protein
MAAGENAPDGTIGIVSRKRLDRSNPLRVVEGRSLR